MEILFHPYHNLFNAYCPFRSILKLNNFQRFTVIHVVLTFQFPDLSRSKDFSQEKWKPAKTSGLQINWDEDYSRRPSREICNDPITTYVTKFSLENSKPLLRKVQISLGERGTFLSHLYLHFYGAFSVKREHHKLLSGHPVVLRSLGFASAHTNTHTKLRRQATSLHLRQYVPRIHYFLVFVQ